MKQPQEYLPFLKDYFPTDITSRVETPCYLISEDLLKYNCEILIDVKKRSGAKVLLALKAYALPETFPLISIYLDGVCASGPYEARLGKEEFGKEVHTFSPAYTDYNIDDVIEFSDHIVFNSIGQFHRYKEKVKGAGKQVGLRVNPGYSEVEVFLYDPCQVGSRFGIQADQLEGVDLSGLDGLHFHAMCQQNSDVLERVLNSFKKKYEKYIRSVKWVNFGGGHHITRDGYDRERLVNLIKDFYRDFPNIKEIYLEPGEAVVFNAGVLVSSVLDIVENGMKIAILDTSAENHMPDVLAMPYRPEIFDAGLPGEKKYTYRLGGVTCLAGDVIGDYSFDRPLEVGDRLVFTDMALYSFVKNTMFNGIHLPSLIVFSLENGKVKVVRRFSYQDYKSRIS
ncbi:MAG: carboxynorspermidine decarboxylase [Calditerrivibrio sp.]|nr:carboxynorspermidine decarboxylase [Calditerrivibrio sp.]